jgi:uncharacterized protein
MNMLVAAHTINEHEMNISDASDRRGSEQPSERMIGRLTFCNGSRAVISASATNLTGANADFWAIGKLISINTVNKRIVGVVYEMNTTSELWSDSEMNVIYIKIELVGEISDTDEGPVFKTGISAYPYLGAVAHRIRVRDLQAIYSVDSGLAVSIGTLSQDETVPASVDIDMMLSRHFAVLGTTGVGKSSAVSILLRKAVSVKPNLRVLILDPHNEYTSAFSDIAITVDSTCLELPFWMFRLEEFADVLFRGRKPLDGEIDILREFIAVAKVRYNTPQTANVSNSLLKRSNTVENSGLTSETPVPYRISDLIKIIDDELGKLDSKFSKSDMRSVMHRLDSMCHDPRFKFMFSKSTIEDNIESVVSNIFRVPINNRPITVFQLAGLPSEVVNAVASVLARIAFDLAMWSQGTYEILVLCEEAHRYVPNDKSLGFAPTRTSIARIAKEGRKYGAYLGVVTQRPGELDPTILSQCSTVFAMRLANERDQEIIKSALSDSSSSTIGFISSIGNREAIAFGEAVATPMRMKFEFQNQDHLPKTASGVAETERAKDKQNTDLRFVINRMRGGERA